MSKAAPWSIKGIDYDVRIAAKEAARRAGMTLGEWLNSVIAEHAAEMGLEPEDFGEDERNDAIARRLANLTRRESRYSRRGDRPYAPRDDFDDMDDHDFRSNRSRRREAIYDEPQPRRSGSPYGLDGDHIVEHTIREIERRNADSSKSDGAVERMQRRLARIEASLERRDDDMGDKSLRRALSRIEARMEALAEREPENANQGSELERRVAEIAARLNAPATTAANGNNETNGLRPLAPSQSGAASRGASGEAVRPSEMARIEAKLNMLLSRDMPKANDGAYANFPTGPSAPPVSDAVAQIQMRQQALDGTPRRSVQPSAAQGQAVASVRNDLHAIASRLDELRRETRERASAATTAPVQPAVPQPALDNLRAQLADMNRAVAELAPRTSIVSLEAAIRDLGARVENSRHEGVRENILQPIETLIRDLKASIQAHTHSPQIDTIERATRDIARRLDTLATNGGRVDDRRLDEIYEQTSGIRELLSAAVARPLPIDTIEQQINALGKRIDLIAARGSSPVGVAAVTENVEEIRAAMLNAYPAEELLGLRDQIDGLSAKFDQAIANGTGSKRLDEIASQHTQKLEGLMREIRERLDDPKSNIAATKSAALQRLDDMAQRIDAVQRTIFQRLERPGEAYAQQSQKLDELITEIRERLEAPKLDAGSDGAAAIRRLDEMAKRQDEKLDSLAQEIRGRLDAPAVVQNAAESDTLKHLNDFTAQQAEKLENLMRDIRERLESPKTANTNSDAAALKRLDDMAQRIDAVQRTLFQRLERPSDDINLQTQKLEALMGEIRDRLEFAPHADASGVPPALYEQIKLLADKVEAVQQPLNGAQIEALEKNVRTLAERLDAAPLKSDAVALDGLERQVRELAERLDHPAASLDSLGNIEQNIAALLNQLDETRLAAADAAETAARKATQEALADLLKQGSLTSSQTDAARQIIAQEIATLRSSQDATDRRTHATLSAVHETLEKVVERLALLEDSIEPKTADTAPAGRDRSAFDETLASGPAPLFQRRATPDTSAESTPHLDEERSSSESVRPESARLTVDRTAPAPAHPLDSHSEDKRNDLKFPQLPEKAAQKLQMPKAASEVELNGGNEALDPDNPLKIDPAAQSLWMDDDELLEPGAGAPAQRAAARRSGGQSEAPTQAGSKSSSSFIAAARAASIAAQAEAEAAAASAQTKRRGGGERKDGAFAEARARAAAAAASLSGAIDRKKGKTDSNDNNDDETTAKAGDEAGKASRSALRNRKVLLSLGLAVAVLVLGTLQFMRAGNVPPAPAPKPAAVKPAAPPATKSETSKPANPQRGASLSPGLNNAVDPASMNNRFVKEPGVDRQPVASVPRLT